MGHIENFKSGDWVVITKEDYRKVMVMGVMGLPEIVEPPLERHDRIRGEPLKVLAVSPPILLVRDAVSEAVAKRNGVEQTSPVPLDMRYVQCTKVNARYVKEYLKPFKITPAGKEIKEKQENKMVCPLCGDDLTERRGPDRVWKITCKGCKAEVVRSKK